MSFGDEDLDDEQMEVSEDAITFSKEEKEAMRKPRRNALIVKLLGKAMGCRFLSSKIEHLWKLGAYKVTDLDNDYYIIRFERKGDYKHVLEGGPGIIGGHYLTVRQWRPNFMPCFDNIEKIITWVRFPNIPVEYFNPIALKRMVQKIGRVIKIDKVTSGGIRGRYARVCVQIDLLKLLQPKILVERTHVLVEYEGLSLIYFDCGIFRHRKESCPKLKGKPTEVEVTPAAVQETQVATKDLIYGPRMLVQHRKKKPMKPNFFKENNQRGDFRERDSRNNFSNSRVFAGRKKICM